MKKRIKQSRYITGIDGIRSLAVIGVIFYHLVPSSLRGGYLGVPILFTVSGYLITDLLRQEWQQNGRISLKDFYIRRMKRLYPSLVVLLLLSSTYIILFQRNLWNNLRGIVVSSLLYVNNWWQINHDLSYFDRFGNESPFTHLWSLAVEGQNYLLWPLIFVLLMKLVKKRDRIFLILVGASLVSALMMALLYTPGDDPTRVYYGTDTRLFSILIGGSLAFIWPSTKMKSTIPKQAKNLLNVAGIVSFLLLVISFLYLSDHLTFVYYGGMYAISWLAAILIAVTAHPGAEINRLLTNPLFTYLGKRSYGIYLYQFPVMIFYEAKVQHIANNVWLHAGIELLLILAASELSYQFVEQPLRKFDYRQTKQKLQQWFTPPLWIKGKAGVWVCSFVTLIAVVGILFAPTNRVDVAQESFQQEIEANRQAAERSKQTHTTPSATTEITESSQPATKESSAKKETTEASTESSADPDVAQVMEKYGLTKAEVEKAQKLEITAFGDSVMLGATINLQEIFPKAVIDADVGRQLNQSAELLKALREEGMLKDRVILALGTNGPATEQEFAQVMKEIGKRQVYLVNVWVPTQRWQNEVNELFANMAEKYDNITLIDWYGESSTRTDLFIYDAVHPNETGRIVYSSLLAKNILQ